MDAPAPLEICLLGGFRVAVQGRGVPASAWRQRRPAAIVKLLALAPSHRLHREHLIEALWPDLDGEATANNLRVALSRARRRLEAAGAAPGSFLVRDGEEIALAASDSVQVDVSLFEAEVARAWLTNDPSASRVALDLYTGDLLPEDLYEDWAANRRVELRANHLTLLARLAQLHEQRHELGRAIATLQRLLHVEPFDEPAHVALIRLFAQTGESRQALMQYDRLAVLLDEELGTEPEPATHELVTAIREGRFPPETKPFAPVTAADQPIAAAADASAHERTGALPAPMENLIGREREIAELRRLIASHRLVTLTGPGGVGKTRLALAAAADAAGDRLEDVSFVDLTPLRDPMLVLPSIVRALGVKETGNQSSLGAVAAHLAGRRRLLVLDNFEHVSSAAPVVAELLASCSGLKTLVTSRGRLRLRGEQEYPVQPLAAPEQSAPTGSPSVLEDLEAFPAPALFMQRAREAKPGLTLTGADTQAVANICRRLDGLPLAIELAAARIRVLPPVALLARLEQPLAVLTGGPRDAPERQRTLRAAIAWSHDLLLPAEQVLFARLAVFAGGFTLDAAEGVAPPEEKAAPFEQGAASSTLDLVASLVEQSLLRQATATSDMPRFSMLETIREFAAERLETSGEMMTTQARHAAYFLTAAEQAESELTGPASAGWLRRLDEEHDNLRLALATLSASGEATAALRLAGALWRFWWLHGHLGEGRARLELALAEGILAAADVRAKALDGAGALAAGQGDLSQATALHSEALRHWREIGDRRGMARALTSLGLVADEQGDPHQAGKLLEDALDLARQAGDRRGVAVALANLGQVALTLADYERAASLLGEALALFRELGDERDQTAILANLGDLAFRSGDFARAEQCHEEALTLLRGSGDRQGEADELLNLGHTVQQRGDLERAAALFAEALDGFTHLGDRGGIAFARNHLGRLAHVRGNDADAEVFLGQGYALGQEIGDQIATVEALEGLATVACARGEAARCARLIGAAEAMREAIGVPLPEVHQGDYQRCLAGARLALGEQEFAVARATGRTFSPAHVTLDPLKLLAGEHVAPEPSIDDP